jgi:gingipain R
MQTQDEITELINNSTKTKTTLGGLFWNGQLSMLEKYGEAGEGVMKTWIFFGDPSTEFRYQETKETKFETNYTELEETLLIEISSSIENLKIGISYKNEFVTSGYINNGKFIVEISKKYNPDSLFITGTKQNYATYNSFLKNNLLVAEEANNKLDEFNIYPNPSNEYMYITGENICEIELSTLEGKTVKYITVVNNEEKTFIDTKELLSGVYLLKVKNNINSSLKKISINH